MKLLLCPHCADIRELRYRRTYCRCRKSWGRYESEDTPTLRRDDD